SPEESSFKRATSSSTARPRRPPPEIPEQRTMDALSPASQTARWESAACGGRGYEPPAARARAHHRGWLAADRRRGPRAPAPRTRQPAAGGLLRTARLG